MHRVVALAVVLTLAWMLPTTAHAAPPAKTAAAIKVKVRKLGPSATHVLAVDSFAMTKILFQLCINPRTKMLSAALEGIAVPLADDTAQRAAKPPAPRLIAMAPPPPLERPLPTTFEPR